MVAGKGSGEGRTPRQLRNEQYVSRDRAQPPTGLESPSAKRHLWMDLGRGDECGPMSQKSDPVTS